MATSSRLFPGFPARRDTETHRLAPRATTTVNVKSGDLVSFSSPATSTVLILAIGPDGAQHAAALGLAADEVIDPGTFEADRLRGWLAGRGKNLETYRGTRIPVGDLVTFRAKSDCTLWFACPADCASMVAGLAPEIILTVKRKTPLGFELPEPLGEIRDEFTVTRGTASAYEVAAGEMVQIIDVEGQQCSDFTAFRSHDLAKGDEVMIDSTATRSLVRQSYPSPGLLDKFFDRNMAPMLRVVQDTCGRHDTFGLACTARGYEERGFPGHINCSDNISAATERFGVKQRSAWPAINFFWNTWIDPTSRQILTEESHSRPGDYVVMEALDDLVCVSTACPDDIDPINGWNPTDVHVRIYRPDAPIRRAVAYRVKEDAPMSISHETAFHPRTSALTDHFAPARDLWTPVSFPATGTTGEYWACREKATLQDMSSLRKYDIVGPDAERLLQRVVTRDVARLAVWRGTYALICDDTGAVMDDGTLFRLAPDLFRWCCGSERSSRVMQDLADREGLNVRIRDMSDALVNLALQGPNSRAVLDPLIFTQPHVPALQHVKWFGVTVARLHDRNGAPFMLARSGYTGELGYEIFCAPSDAVTIWDALMAAGADHGLVPMGNAALDILRMEAGLAAAGAEFAPGCDAYEAGLGFAVNLEKSDFIGKSALERNKQSMRRVLKGLKFDSLDLPLPGAPVFVGEQQVGEVTSAVRSPMYERTLAMARLAVEHAATGMALQVGMMDGHMKRLPCTVSDIPFYDPKRERARA